MFIHHHHSHAALLARHNRSGGGRGSVLYLALAVTKLVALLILMAIQVSIIIPQFSGERHYYYERRLPRWACNFVPSCLVIIWDDMRENPQNYPKK